MKKIIILFFAIIATSLATQAQCIKFKLADQTPFNNIQGISLNPATGIVTAQMPFTIYIEKVNAHYVGKFEQSATMQVQWNNTVSNTANEINAICIDSANAYIARTYPDLFNNDGQ